MQLRAVDFPQPEGPRSAMNSRLRTTSERSLSAATVPEDSVTKRRVIPTSRSSAKSFASFSERPAPAPERAPRVARGNTRPLKQ